MQPVEKMTAYLVLASFLIFTLGGGLLIGFWFRPDEWYRTLRKPWFTPPNAVFAPVWTLLYVAIAFVGWRTFIRDSFGEAMIVWVIALALNFIWAPMFFGAHRPAAALAVIIVLLGMILLFVRLSWPADPLSALLFALYGGWVAFAAALNAAICKLNAARQ
jgi:tryptophan-rich sensory protein